jgi:tetratricopeptide (TPR) repeat protein
MNELPVAALESHLQKQAESARQAFERGNFDYAIDLCRNVLTEAPGCLPVRKLQRTAQLKRGANGALAQMFGSVSTAPFLFSGSMALGKNPARAMESAQKLIEADPHSAAGLRMLGAAATALGWHETAVFAYEALRETDPDNGPNLVALGSAHLAAGRPDHAVQCAELALRQEPTHAGAQSLLRDASVAQTMRRGRWEDTGDFRGKVRPPA